MQPFESHQRSSSARAAAQPAAPRSPAFPRPPVAPARPTVPPGAPPLPYESALEKKKKWRPQIWQMLFAGYSTFGRSFAYLGVPPLFIGELYLVGSIVQNRGKWLNRFIDGVLRLHLLPLSIMLVMLWGLFDVARPVLAGSSIKECLRTCAFNYYPLFIAVGIGIGRQMTVAGFARFWQYYCIYYVLYSIAYATVGSSIQPMAPWRGDIPLFMGPALSPLVPVSILAMWTAFEGSRLRYALLPLSMIPMFFASGRGTILGFAVGILVVAAQSLRRFLLVMGLVGVIFAILMIIGPFIKGGSERAETFDPTINIARVLATFDEDAAYRMLLRRGYYAAADEMLVAKGTASWRKDIWRNAVAELNNTWLLAVGQGHGRSIGHLTPDGQEIHTPHNFVIYAMYYTGVIGLLAFGFMLFALLLSSRRIGDANVRSFQFAHIFMMCIVALVGNMFETPIAAIPFYLLTGVCIGLPGRSPAGASGFGFPVTPIARAIPAGGRAYA